MSGKLGKWPGRILKLIAFFAVLGCIVLFFAVKLLTGALNDMSSFAPNPPPPTTNTSVNGK